MKISFSRLVIFLFFYFFSIACSPKKEIPLAKNGLMDLSQWNFSQNGTVDLNGDWEFYWQKFLEPTAFASVKTLNQNKSYIVVPSIWNDHLENGQKIGMFGFATYHLTVKLPEKYVGRQMALKLRDFATSYKLWINGKYLSENGQAGTTKETTRPAYQHLVKSFTVDQNRLDIVVHCANFHYAKAGIWENIILGNEDSVNEVKYLNLSYNLFLIGALIMMAIYHFGLFLLRTKERSTLLFGLFTLLIGIRSMFRGEMFVDTLFPDINFALQIKIEYLSYYLSVPVFYWFIHQVFVREFNKIVGYVVFGITMVFSLAVIVTPPTFFTQFVLYFHLVTVLTALWVMISLIRAAIHRQHGSYSAVLGFLALFTTMINDIMHTNNVIQTAELASLGLFIFIFSQSFMLSLRFSMAFFDVETLSLNLEKLNKANSRFVPEAVLSFLQKKSITDVQLGDNIEKRMSILFSDIRNFTSISENMSPEQNFLFLNSYLKKIGPVIRQNKGFIDKYLGDGIMALFPEDVTSAVDAAIEIQLEIRIYNGFREKVNYPPVVAGIGIHIGNLMLGTIGEEERIDATVISDSVNLSSRLEGLTKIFGVSIIISHDVYEALDKKKYHFRKLGTVRVKGKRKAIAVYEIMDCYITTELDLKIKTKEDFENAVDLFNANQSKEAKTLFEKVVAINPNDQSALYYIKHITGADKTITL